MNFIRILSVPTTLVYSLNSFSSQRKLKFFSIRCILKFFLFISLKETTENFCFMPIREKWKTSHEIISSWRISSSSFLMSKRKWISRLCRFKNKNFEICIPFSREDFLFLKKSLRAYMRAKISAVFSKIFVKLKVSAWNV